MKFTPARRQKFLECLAQWGNVTRAAQAIGMTRRRMEQVRHEDEAFKAAWDAAIEESRDVIDQEIFRRGIEGVDEPVISMGRIVMTENPDGSKTPLMVRKYSDALLVHLSKGSNPEKYRARATVAHTDADGKNLQVTAVSVFAEMIERLAAKMRPRAVEAPTIDATPDKDEK